MLPAQAQRNAQPVITKPVLASPQVTTHSATLTWTASTQCGFALDGVTPATCIGYNIYRGTAPGQETPLGFPGQPIPTLVTGTTFTDTGVVAGQTYYYVVTTMNSASITSVFSNEVQAVIPGGSSTTQTLLTTQIPAQVNLTDGSINYELGLKFQTNLAGQVTAIRFWKGSKDTGTHTGHLWGPTGTLLATVVFVGETASGWQQQALATPVSIAAGTAYTASVNTTATFYVATDNGLASQIVSSNLSSIVGGNGSYSMIPGRFPTFTWHASNYFRDVVFSTSAPPPTLSISCPTAVAGVTNLQTGAYSMSVMQAGATATCSGIN